jgi:LPXTG-motif cell wall-anchored protein
VATVFEKIGGGKGGGILGGGIGLAVAGPLGAMIGGTIGGVSGTVLDSRAASQAKKKAVTKQKAEIAAYQKRVKEQEAYLLANPAFYSWKSNTGKFLYIAGGLTLLGGVFLLARKRRK